MKWILAVLMALMLAGCALRPRPYHYLVTGMEMSEVRQKCGYCLHRRQWSDGTAVWQYESGETIWFENGRVVSWSW